MNGKNSQDIIEEVSASYERELIRKIRDLKDREAYFHLVKLYDGKVFSVAYRILGNKDDAVEIAQDVFIRVYRKIGQYRGEAPFGSWIRKIAVNLSLNRLKARKIDTLNGAASFEGNSVENPEQETPESLLESAERKKALMSALLKVPEDFRAAVILKDIEGYKYSEIADMLGINMGTLKSRLSRGRLELKKLLYGIKQEATGYEM